MRKQKIQRREGKQGIIDLEIIQFSPKTAMERKSWVQYSDGGCNDSRKDNF